MTIETKIAKNGSKRYYVRDENGKCKQISAEKAYEIERQNKLAALEQKTRDYINGIFDEYEAANGVQHIDDEKAFRAILTATLDGYNCYGQSRCYATIDEAVNAVLFFNKNYYHFNNAAKVETKLGTFIGYVTYLTLGYNGNMTFGEKYFALKAAEAAIDYAINTEAQEVAIEAEITNATKAAEIEAANAETKAAGSEAEKSNVDGLNEKVFTEYGKTFRIIRVGNDRVVIEDGKVQLIDSDKYKACFDYKMSKYVAAILDENGNFKPKAFDTEEEFFAEMATRGACTIDPDDTPNGTPDEGEDDFTDDDIAEDDDDRDLLDEEAVAAKIAYGNRVRKAKRTKKDNDFLGTIEESPEYLAKIASPFEDDPITGEPWWVKVGSEDEDGTFKPYYEYNYSYGTNDDIKDGCHTLQEAAQFVESLLELKEEPWAIKDIDGNLICKGTTLADLNAYFGTDNTPELDGSEEDDDTDNVFALLPDISELRDVEFEMTAEDGDENYSDEERELDKQDGYRFTAALLVKGGICSAPHIYECPKKTLDGVKTYVEKRLADSNITAWVIKDIDGNLICKGTTLADLNAYFGTDDTPELDGSEEDDDTDNAFGLVPEVSELDTTAADYIAEIRDEDGDPERREYDEYNPLGSTDPIIRLKATRDVLAYDMELATWGAITAEELGDSTVEEFLADLTDEYNDVCRQIAEITPNGAPNEGDITKEHNAEDIRTKEEDNMTLTIPNSIPYDARAHWAIDMEIISDQGEVNLLAAQVEFYMVELAKAVEGHGGIGYDTDEHHFHSVHIWADEYADLAAIIQITGVMANQGCSVICLGEDDSARRDYLMNFDYRLNNDFDIGNDVREKLYATLNVENSDGDEDEAEPHPPVVEFDDEGNITAIWF